MKIHFYSPARAEKWDWGSPETTGIGGSETSHIEMAVRLARRGHQVFSYTHRDGEREEHEGVIWDNLKAAWRELTQDGSGLWIIYRHAGFPRDLDKVLGEAGHQPQDQHLWLVVQDVDCQFWAEEDTPRFERIMPLCGDHEEYLLRKHPEAEGRLFRSSNGLKTELIRRLEAEGIERNPKRLMFASSPDRGLPVLLKIFERAREWVPDLELHLFYGTQGLEKAMEEKPCPPHVRAGMEAVERAKSMKNVTWHGRVSHSRLIREWFKTGLWVYPTWFSETSCICCLQAQACGAIPITRPYWALRENVKHGVMIQGNPAQPMVQARYVDAIRHVAQNPEAQGNIRGPMMFGARTDFAWERIVDQWERWILDIEGSEVGEARYVHQFAFQHKHARGSILNVGCSLDPGMLKAARGATNLDYNTRHPYFTQWVHPVDIVADARELPSDLTGRFDSVVLGDILEHMGNEDIVTTLKGAKRCLRDGGPIIITWAAEAGERSAKHLEYLGMKQVPDGTEYAPGCPATHTRIIGREQMLDLVHRAGLRETHVRPIEYDDIPGWGVIAC